MPRLVDFFGEIADILPPTSPSQGWLVSMSGGGEARAVMDVSACVLMWITEIGLR